MLYNNIKKKSNPYLDIKVTAPGSAFCQLLICLFVSDEKAGEAGEDATGC